VGQNVPEYSSGTPKTRPLLVSIITPYLSGATFISVCNQPATQGQLSLTSLWGW